MRAEPRAPGQGRSFGALIRRAYRHHPYALLTLGALAFVLCLWLLTDARVPGGAYVPLALVVVGSCMIAAALAPRAFWKRPGTPTAGAPDSTRSETRVVSPSYDNRDVEGIPQPTPVAWSEAHPRSFPPPSKEAASVPADPGNFLWEPWRPSVGKLPVNLVGPVPQSAYEPPPPGPPSLYEEVERAVLGLSGLNRAAERASSGALESPNYFHPSSRLPSGVARPGGEEVGYAQDAGGEEFVVQSTFREEVTIGDLVLREALNPIPPHLRPDPKPVRPQPINRPFDPRERADSLRCTNCDDPVRSPQDWRRCPDCLQHLCERCIVRALLDHSRGWCSGCAQRRKLDELFPVGVA